MESLEGMVELPELEDLSMQGNGIISLVGIEEKFPNLTVFIININEVRIFCNTSSLWIPSISGSCR